MSRFKDISGQRFTRLIALSVAGKKYRRFRWNCICDCGCKLIVDGNALRTGGTKSCGCLSDDLFRQRTTKHGFAKRKAPSPEYRAWCGMIKRCENRRGRDWADYGGRGIAVHPEWRTSFPSFLSHIGKKPFAGAQLDRIDVNGSYEPGNVRWATPEQQQRNKRNNRVVAIGTETKTLAEWTELAGFPEHLIRRRLNKGWNPEKAISIPPLPRHRPIKAEELEHRA